MKNSLKGVGIQH